MSVNKLTLDFRPPLTVQTVKRLYYIKYRSTSTSTWVKSVKYLKISQRLDRHANLRCQKRSLWGVVQKACLYKGNNHLVSPDGISDQFLLRWRWAPRLFSALPREMPLQLLEQWLRNWMRLLSYWRRFEESGSMGVLFLCWWLEEWSRSKESEWKCRRSTEAAIWEMWNKTGLHFQMTLAAKLIQQDGISNKSVHFNMEAW